QKRRITDFADFTDVQPHGTIDDGRRSSRGCAAHRLLTARVNSKLGQLLDQLGAMSETTQLQAQTQRTSSSQQCLGKRAFQVTGAAAASGTATSEPSPNWHAIWRPMH